MPIEINVIEYNNELAARQKKLNKAKREHKKCHRNVQNLSNRKDKELKRNSRRMAFKRPRVECNGCTTLDATLQIQLDIQYGCYDCKYKQAKKKLAYLNDEEKLAKDNLEKFQADYCPREDSDTSTTTPTESSYEESSTDNSTESEIKEELIDGPIGNFMKSEAADSFNSMPPLEEISSDSMPPLEPINDSFSFYIGEHPDNEPEVIAVSDATEEFCYSSEIEAASTEDSRLEYLDETRSSNDEHEEAFPICADCQNYPCCINC